MFSDITNCRILEMFQKLDYIHSFFFFAVSFTAHNACCRANNNPGSKKYLGKSKIYRMLKRDKNTIVKIFQEKK